MAYGVEQAETAGHSGRPRSSYLADPNASSTTSLRSAVHRSGTGTGLPPIHAAHAAERSDDPIETHLVPSRVSDIR